MSGIAGIFLPSGARPLQAADVEPMARALGGSGSDSPLVLEGGKLALAARAASGYLTGLRTRRMGASTVALAFHGHLVPGLREGARAAADTDLLEALLTLLLECGPGAIAELRGEFALAFWDGRSQSLHVATDRFRIQSLLYANQPDQFLFGSRMRALLLSPVPFRPAVDPRSLLDVVAESIVATPRTIFRGVEKLPPAHRLLVQEGRLTVEAYWDLDFTHPDGASPTHLAADVRGALDAAVADRLSAEGSEPSFGTFLSGGIDSSTVTGLLTRFSGAPVPTFSIGFGEEKFNELHYARVAAAAFGSRHTEYLVTAKDVGVAIETAIEAFDEPFANASAIPTFCCAVVAREHGVTTLYAGDGGDELFAGNERYSTSRVFARYDRVPRWIRAPLLTPAIGAAGTLLPWPFLIKAKKYVQRASLPPGERLVSYGFWSLVPLRQFVEEDLLEAAHVYRPSSMFLWHYARARARTELDRQLYVDLKITISDNDLFKVTRMCEQAGVAVRFPFLDERVVDAAMRVPARLKMRRGELRTFFKEAYGELLPLEIRQKRKHGFGLPISMWLRSDRNLNEMMRELVLGRRGLERGYFKRAALEDLVRRHAEDPTPFYGTILWNLMVLELWHRRVLDATAG